MHKLLVQFASMWTMKERGDSIEVNIEHEEVKAEESTSTNRESGHRLGASTDRFEERDMDSSSSQPLGRDGSRVEGDHGDNLPLIHLVNPWGTYDQIPPPNWRSKSSGVSPARCKHSDESIEGFDKGPTGPIQEVKEVKIVWTFSHEGTPDCGREDVAQADTNNVDTNGVDIRPTAENDGDALIAAEPNEDFGENPFALEHAEDTNRTRRREDVDDIVFVSPSKRIARRFTPRNGFSIDEEEEWRSREYPASYLTFRTGIFKAVVSGGRSGDIVPRRRKMTREVRDTLIRRAFIKSHPTLEPEEEREELDPALLAEFVELRRKDEELHEKIMRMHREGEEEEERRTQATLDEVRAFEERARAILGEAESVRAQLVNEASVALKRTDGADMRKLRDLFAGSVAVAARFKHDAAIGRLEREFTDLEDLLGRIKDAQRSDKMSELGKLLSSRGAEKLQRERDFRSAKEAHRIWAENAAVASAAKAEKERAAKQARAEAVKQAQAEAAAAAQAAAAARAREKVEQDALKAQNQATKARKARAKFVEDASELKDLVKERREATSEIATSTDPAVKKARMAFKKSYQGCLNKLSVAPETVREVVDMIYSKAKEPLEEARRAGWGDKAQEFLLVNIADKLTSYSELDQFNANGFEMAFPHACVAVDLMVRHKELPDLFLGTLYSRCPSAIPSLSFDTTGKSDAEVMRAFGMLEGETLSLFIGRTKGLIVMMAAIMQTPGSGPSRAPHPLPLSKGWSWLARFLNALEVYVSKGMPLPPTAGPSLEWFLKIAGFEMQRRYGRAVDKLVHLIKSDVLPHLLPKSRVPHLLDVVLKDYEENGRRFLPPLGRQRFENFRRWGAT